jgi:hypothetical protein
LHLGLLAFLRQEEDLTGSNRGLADMTFAFDTDPQLAGVRIGLHPDVSRHRH